MLTEEGPKSQLIIERPILSHPTNFGESGIQAEIQTTSLTNEPTASVIYNDLWQSCIFFILLSL